VIFSLSRMRIPRLVICLGIVTALTVPSSAVWAYTQDPYNAANNTSQQTCAWCVVGSAITWLKYIPGSSIPSQSNLSSSMTNYWDKYPYNSGSCTEGSPPVTYYGHDPRGWAWGMYANTPAGYYFNDYKRSKTLSGARSIMNWEFVLGVRADGHPTGAIVEGGAHAIDVIGYYTAYDPWSTHTQTLYGFYVFDPWYPRSGGLTPNTYITISNWNSYWYLPDTQDGAFWYNTYDAVLRANTTLGPGDTEPQSYGDYQLGLHQGLSALQAGHVEAANTASPTIPAAISDGLKQAELQDGARLGIDLTNYAVGPTVHVTSLVADIPSYDLVELVVGQSPRAIVLVSLTGRGYEFGAITPLVGSPDYMPGPMRDKALSAAGMSASSDLVWAPTTIGATPFMPFIRGVDAVSGRPTFLTVNGRADSLSLTYSPED
jgi:hypothetical protein